MRKIITIFVLLLISFNRLLAQTPLTEAVEFNVKTLESETIRLFPLLDAGNIVVIDFFSTSCGPCQTFAYDFEMAYQNFGSNQGNVFFLAINYNSDNEGVRIFDSIFHITLPSASGIEGGGNAVYESYQISAYPTVILITPDHQITEQFIWEPTAENITNAVVNAGGTLVGESENGFDFNRVSLFPNPVNDVLNLRFVAKQTGAFSYRIIDLSGRVCLRGDNLSVSVGSNQRIVDVKRLPAGVYFLEQTINNDHVISNKIVVE
ncbi:MAG: T9SS type A sorting domain-containing protein [Bacteroidales bacterium]|nr:T9SS type A sorting domain-containing protein [Bacteroidales bacterium]